MMSYKFLLCHLVVYCGLIVAVRPTVSMVPSKAVAESWPLVETQQGTLRGETQADGSVVFKAIPYAAVPVGTLRWKAPQPAAKWSGVRDTAVDPPSCMQEDWGWNSPDAKSSSEDCLYLNIVTPSLHPAQLMPVIFWIHGGGYYNGSGRLFTGQMLTRHGVVLVSINYRLGVFGFFSHPALTKESPQHTSGNYAIQDQIAALQWVHDNISRFGGDPDRVTIAGQSAGAMSVGVLMVTPASRGLFAHAIAESGGPVSPEPILPVLRTAEAMGEKLAEFAGMPSGPEQLDALRAVPAEKLLEIARRFTAPDPEGVPTREGPGVIVDGVVIPEEPVRAVRNGRIHRVPLLIGSNIQEFSFSRSSTIHGSNVEPAEDVRARIRQSFGEEAADAMRIYGLDRSDQPVPDSMLGTVGTQLMTDLYFRCPATITAHWLTGRGVVVWQYDFERALPGTGATSTRHSGELPYVFGWAQREGRGIFGAFFGPQDVHLSEQMQAYWVNFARDGDPNGEGLPRWPKTSNESIPVMRFTSDGAVSGQSSKQKLCEIYERHLTLSCR
jgi:para-nitrobenzyl esterase